MKLARGDRRKHVVVTHEGEFVSVARYTGKKTKEVTGRFGDPEGHQSVDEAKTQFAKELTPRFEFYLKEREAKETLVNAQLDAKRQSLTNAHRAERQRVEQHQKQRWEQEARERSERINKGFRGLWDRISGERKMTEVQNIKEAHQALRRDRQQKQRLIRAQLDERQPLQEQYRQHRAQSVKGRLEIHKRLDDLRKGRLGPRRQKPPPKELVRTAKPAFAKANPLQTPPKQTQSARRQPESKRPVRLKRTPEQLRETPPPSVENQTNRQVPTKPQDRLEALRKKKRGIDGLSRWPDGLSNER